MSQQFVLLDVTYNLRRLRRLVLERIIILPRYIFGVLLGLMRGPQQEEPPPEPTEEEKIGQLKLRLLTQQSSKTHTPFRQRVDALPILIVAI